MGLRTVLKICKNDTGSMIQMILPSFILKVMAILGFECPIKNKQYLKLKQLEITRKFS